MYRGAMLAWASMAMRTNPNPKIHRKPVMKMRQILEKGLKLIEDWNLVYHFLHPVNCEGERSIHLSIVHSHSLYSATPLNARSMARFAKSGRIRCIVLDSEDKGKRS